MSIPEAQSILRPVNSQLTNAAETALKAEQTKPQYSLTLLNIVASDALPAKTRLAAALAFKNFIRNNYVVRKAAIKLLRHPQPC